MTRKEVVQEVISLIRTLGAGIITAILAVSIFITSKLLAKSVLISRMLFLNMYDYITAF